ncbi:MAG: outer membrane lipoprotein chaperone LolA [Rhodocyclaceae bacterium]|nr:outer membrane lipoprotein chaperone LolA [Rhodocyclaceae bacterium]
MGKASAPRRLGVLLSFMLLAGAAEASGLEQLHAFLTGTKSGKAEFSQMVTAKSGNKPPQMASGSFVFSRPGKFRWAYEKPYAQLIVADGEKLWAWDKDLNQVTVKKLGQALGGTPAALLAGDNALEKNFNLKEAGEANDLEWVEATPKAADSSFAQVRIGLKGGLPSLMEISDNFGQTTHLIFDHFVRNPPVDASTFRFAPPKGADVVGE